MTSIYTGFPGGSAAKNLHGMQEIQETRVQSLGQEDPLEEEIATHSSILAWRIPWAEEPGGLQSTLSKRVGHNQATNTFIFTYLSLYLVKSHLFFSFHFNHHLPGNASLT